MPKLENLKPLPAVFEPDGSTIVSKIYTMGLGVREGDYQYTDKQMGNYLIDVQYEVWRQGNSLTDKVKDILGKVDDLNRHQLVDELNDVLGMLEEIS